MQRPLILLLAISMTAAFAGAEEPDVAFFLSERQLQIEVGGQPFATYVFKHDAVLRPFFVDVHAPNGSQVTRNFPPVEGQDSTDHATFHPGIWLAFGDVAGADFWRNKAVVRHVRFFEAPEAGAGEGQFAVQNHYESEGMVLCEETCRVGIHVRPAGVLLALDSTFTASEDMYFGDQEEMGLGVRVASPIAVQNGGRIANSDGMLDEKQVWGRQADWCEYSGLIGGRRAGMLMMPHPDNFRRAWFHARDYGLLVANPFGRKAFTQGETSRVQVNKGDSFQLRFGIFVFDGEIDGKAAYRNYVEAAGSEN